MTNATILLLLQIASYAPPEAVDYVATMETLNTGMSPEANRSLVYRSGQNMRVESQDSFRGESTYTDLGTGLETSVQRDGRGLIRRVTIGHPSRRVTRLQTDRHDVLLGESCTVSRLTEEGSSTGQEVCETSDGIMLWNAFWYPNGGTSLYQRATAIERRPVRPEEVLPPRASLSLGPEALPADPTILGAEGDYEAEMVGQTASDGSYVLRRHGRFSSRTQRGPGERWYDIGNGAVRVFYSEDDAERPKRLEIDRAGSRFLLPQRWERVPGRAPESLLGETCTWQNNAAIESSDSSIACRTADGIVLKTETEYHWTGRTERFTARRLSRRPLRDEDFAPPARALDWAHWGITPAP